MRRLYEVLIDGGADNIFKVLRFAFGEYDLKEQYKRVGKIVRAVDVTDDCPICVDKVYAALIRGGFGKIEANIVKDIVDDVYSNAR